MILTNPRCLGRGYRCMGQKRLEKSFGFRWRHGLCFGGWKAGLQNAVKAELVT